MTRHHRPVNPPLLVGSMVAFVAGTVMASEANMVAGTQPAVGQYVLGAALLLVGMVVFAFEVTKL